MDQDDVSQLAGVLNDLLGEPVELSDVFQRSQGETVVSLAILNGRQHVLLLRDPKFDLPTFFVDPIWGVERATPETDVDSEEVRFDAEHMTLRFYRVSGLTDREVDALFSSEICEWFNRMQGWRVRGDGCCLAVLYDLKHQDDRGTQWFAGTALPLVQLFQRSSVHLNQLDATQSSDFESGTFDDAVQSAPDGADSPLPPRLRIAVAELDSFLASVVPRRPPSGMVRQIVGDVMIISVVGFFFLFFGAGLMYASAANAGGNGPPLLFGFFFALTGGLMVTLTRRFRRGKIRILRYGDLVTGRIVSVTKTNVEINDQPRYHVGVRYSIGGHEYLTRINSYGTSVKRARHLKKTEQLVRLLADPRKPDNVICLDLLAVST